MRNEEKYKVMRKLRQKPNGKKQTKITLGIPHRHFYLHNELKLQDLIFRSNSDIWWRTEIKTATKCTAHHTLSNYVCTKRLKDRICKAEGRVIQLCGKEPDIQTLAVHVNTRYITQDRIE